MKGILLKFYASLLFAACSSHLFAGTNMPGDSVTINGKFITPCFVPKLKVWRYSTWELPVYRGEARVDKNDEFRHRVEFIGPEQISLQFNQNELDIIATPNEKIYTIEISCTGTGQLGKVEVKNSPENEAFAQLYAAGKGLTDSVSEALRRNYGNKNNFSALKQVFMDYQHKVSSIAQAYPQSFIARVLCKSEILPESTFTSLETFKEKYLQREALADTQFYNFALFPAHTLVTYLSVFGKDDTDFTGFANALDIACTNPEAGKQLEEILYNTLFMRGREQLLIAYVNWAKLHPDKMFNLQAKIKLTGMQDCLAGAQYPEIRLKDTAGVERRLSETVASGKIILLLFYGTNCSHCRETVPKLVPIYNEFKDKGFRIYAVAGSTTHEEWVDFINTMGTGEWTNVLKTGYGPETGTKYMVNGYPGFILIGGDGKIITRFAGVDYIKQELPRYLSK